MAKWILFVGLAVLLVAVPASAGSSSRTLQGGDTLSVTCNGLRLTQVRNNAKTRTLTCTGTPSTTTSTTTTTRLPTTTVTTTTIAATTTTHPTTGYFNTLPVGSVLPSDATCASLVRDKPEVRANNVPFNNTVGVSANDIYPRVTGSFTGTTDEILQWVACKWGLDEDIVRAQIVRESYWDQRSVGDNGESFGLGQVRVPYHQSAFENNNAKLSSAYNVDYTYAVWRECFEGRLTWLNTVDRGREYVAGDVWGCLGVWFSGRWYTQPAIDYMGWVRGDLDGRIWMTSDFLSYG